MKFKSVFPYNFKKLIPMLGLAGATLMTPSCSKDDDVPARDVTINVTQSDSKQVVADGRKYAQDPSVKNLYFVIADGGDWTNFYRETIKSFTRLMSEIYDMGNGKCHGKGDLTFEVGVGDPADSLIIVNKLGFTYNKYLQNQK